MFEAVFALWFFDFDDDVRRRGLILLPDDDIGGLLVDRGAEVNGFFNGNPLLRIAVVDHQLAEIELADDFLGLGWARFVAGGTGEVGFSCFVKKFDGFDFLLCKDSEGIVRTGISDRIIDGSVSKFESMSLGSKFVNQ